MKKLKRTKKEYGGGSGGAIFKSDLFRVVIWRLREGIRTTLNVSAHPFNEIHFDGEHKELDSDSACMAQLTPKEVRAMIEAIRVEGFEAGREHKAEEIKQCLYLR